MYHVLNFPFHGFGNFATVTSLAEGLLTSFIALKSNPV